MSMQMNGHDSTLSHFAVDGQIVGMVKMAVYEQMRQFVGEMSQKIQERDALIDVLQEQIRDLVESHQRIEGQVVAAREVQLTGKKHEVNNILFEQFKEKISLMTYQQKSAELRKLPWRILKRIKKVRHIEDKRDLSIAWNEIYLRFSKIAGYDPREIGKERKDHNQKSGPSYFATCYNRGHFDLLFFIANQMSEGE